MLESIDKFVGKVVTRGTVLCLAVAAGIYIWYLVNEKLQDQEYAK